jgi:N-dimethylarginine dimethylaminohydrolase
MPQPKILMCPPTHFSVDYVINPWMMPGRVERRVAEAQWQALRDLLAKRAEVITIEPQPGLPDMVFTANAGVVVENRVMASHFTPRERRAEEQHFKDWFARQGYSLVELPDHVGFEGAGDCLYDARRDLLWTGLGSRTEPEALHYLWRGFEVEIVALRLVDPRFYHLDTCFCPLSSGDVMYFPAAFHATSLREIEQRVPQAQRILVDESDAAAFACNAVCIGDSVYLSSASSRLRAALQRAGYSVYATALDEFIKAGGSARCLTLRLSGSS